MELRQYDDDVTDLNADQQNKETKKKKKTVLHASHQRFSFMFKSQPLSFNQRRREMTCFALVWKKIFAQFSFYLQTTGIIFPPR